MSTLAQVVMAKCHPDRRSARRRDNLCLECVLDNRRDMANRRRAKLGKPLIMPLTDKPARIPGVRQNAVTRVPDRCDKCGNRLLLVEGRMIRCPGVRGGCGKDWYLVAP